MPSILVVAHEAALRELIRRHLEQAGFAVRAVDSGATALVLAEADAAPPDLVLLDPALPDVDGGEVLDALAPRLPVVLLSDRATVRDRVLGLERGAADYITKPFSTAELVLRVRAVLARAGGWPIRDAWSFGSGQLEIDRGGHEVRFRGRLVELTPSEWMLLNALASRPHQVLSRGQLTAELCECAYAGYERVVDSHVKNIRRKLGDEERAVVQTVTGFGYRLGLDRDC